MALKIYSPYMSLFAASEWGAPFFHAAGLKVNTNGCGCHFIFLSMKVNQLSFVQLVTFASIYP